MLAYPETTPIVLFGTKTVAGVRTPVALTTAYTGNVKTFASGGFSELVLDISYTTGASETGTKIDIQILDSVDGINFYHLTNESASAGLSTLTDRTFERAGGAGSTNYAYSYRLDISYKFLRVQVQETTVSANAGTVFIEGVLAGY